MKQSYLENGGTIVSGSEYRDVRTVLRSLAKCIKAALYDSRNSYCYDLSVIRVYVSHTFATDMLIRLWIFVTNIFFLVHSVECRQKITIIVNIINPDIATSKSNCMRITIEVTKPMAARTGKLPLVLIGDTKSPLRLGFLNLNTIKERLTRAYTMNIPKTEIFATLDILPPDEITTIIPIIIVTIIAIQGVFLVP